MQYKLGKKPARPGAVKFTLADYGAALPAAPAKAGHYAAVIDWQGMLGNDNYGDCVWAGGDHEHIDWNAEANTKVSFTPETALADYSAVTGFNPNDPNTDEGTDVQVAASYRLKTGLIDANGKRHKIGAYVAGKVGDKLQLRQGVFYFGAVGIGINFPNSAMDQFNEGKPWSVVKSTVEGGHYVPVVGYDAKYLYVVTWGKIQKMTWGFFAKYCDEVFVYLSSEMLKNNESPEGFNLKQLQADLKAL